MRKTCAITFTLLFLRAVACGLAIPQSAIPKSGNAFFGYSYSGGQVFNGAAIHVPMNGWEGSVEGKFFPRLGVVADFDWHYGGHQINCTSVGPNCPSSPLRSQLNGSRHSILFGPRVSTSFGKYTPFAHFLVGLALQSDAAGTTSTSDKSFCYAAGGGLDYKLVDSVAWRVQADWVHSPLFGSSQGNFRVSTGIVFRF